MVAVVIANHNHEAYISFAIDSVIKQTYQSQIDIYVIDDCSTDNSMQKIKYIADKKHPNRKIYYASLDKNMGASIARNIGITEALKAGHEYIAILDADDMMKPTKLDRCLPLLNNTIGVVYDDYDTLDEETGIIQRVYKENFCHHRIFKNCILHNSVVAKADVFKKCGLYDTQMEVAEDWDLWIRVSKQFRILHIPEVHTQIRITRKNSTNSVSRDVWIKNWRLIKDRYATPN